MDAKVLVDTSVWITFFRKKDSELTERIATLLKSGRAVYTGIIALELINGAKGQHELRILYDAFDTMQGIVINENTYLHAGKTRIRPCEERAYIKRCGPFNCANRHRKQPFPFDL